MRRLTGLLAVLSASRLGAAEEARHRFTTGAREPFDALHPPPAFEAKARRAEAERRLLHERYGVAATSAMKEPERARIDRATREPEPWRAIQEAVGSREGTARAVCGPALVGRLLRDAHASDAAVHASRLETARAAQAVLRAGGTPDGTRRLRLAQGGATGPSLEDLLRGAREGTPHRAFEAETADRPVPVAPALAAVLGVELARPGDVTRILEEPDRFTVFRLVRLDDAGWEVDAVTVPKAALAGWLDEELARGDGRGRS